MVAFKLCNMIFTWNILTLNAKKQIVWLIPEIRFLGEGKEAKVLFFSLFVTSHQTTFIKEQIGRIVGEFDNFRFDRRF